MSADSTSAVHHLSQVVCQVFAAQDGPSVLVDHFALLVHDVVVLQQLFADFEIVRFDLLLGVGDGAGNHPVLDRDAFFHAELEHQLRDPFGGEDAHQVVFQRQIEPRRARIALAAGAASELVVDTAALVPFRSRGYGVRRAASTSCLSFSQSARISS